MALRYKWLSSFFAIPLKSPLISIIKTGMPKLDNVQKGLEWFCFPVPVTHAIKPWRFKVFKGTFYECICKTSPSKVHHQIILSPLELYPQRLCLVKSSFFTHNKF
jgi:hypothetical protein